MRRVDSAAIRKQYYSAAEVGRLLGIATESARQWIVRNKIGRKISGRWMVHCSRLMAHFPEAFQSIVR